MKFRRPQSQAAVEGVGRPSLGLPTPTIEHSGMRSLGVSPTNVPPVCNTTRQITRHISRKRQLRVSEIIWGVVFLPPLPFPSRHPPFPFPLPPPSPPFPSLPLPLEVGPLNTARGSGERCKLPQRGLGSYI